MNTVLEGLRDIHLPAPVSWWPPAPGWWFLLALLVLLSGAGWFLRGRIFRATRRVRVCRAAWRELQALQAAYAARGDARRLVGELSVWLRRVSLSLRPRPEVAGLIGAAWLEELDRCLPERPFSSGIGRVFTHAPYAADAPPNAQALLRLCRRWLQAQRRW